MMQQQDPNTLYETPIGKFLFLSVQKSKVFKDNPK